MTTPTFSLDAIVRIVRAFVATRTGRSADDIGPATLLLRDGRLDSFSLVELIVELERGLDVSLDAGALIPEDFETPLVLLERLRDIAAA